MTLLQTTADKLFGKGEQLPIPKPGRTVRMEVIMRWTRMKWPDGMSFTPLQDGFGWVPKIESTSKAEYKKPDNSIINLCEKRRYG